MRFYLLIVTVIWHVACSEAGKQGHLEALRRVKQHSNTFEWFLSQHVTAEYKGNLVFSSPSTWTLLSMTAYGARENTRLQMRGVLWISRLNDIVKNGCRAFIDSLEKYKSAGLHLTNKIFLNQIITPESKFRSILNRNFRSKVRKVDFSDPVEGWRTINEWFQAHMNNGTKDLMKPAGVSSSTTMVLGTAAYFKGTWVKPFNSNRTEERPFYLNSTTPVNVPTMCRQGYYRNGNLKKVNASFVEIPYKSEGIEDPLSMFIVIPHKNVNLAELEKDIRKLKVYNPLRYNETMIELCLPKFKIENGILLKRPLEKMEMTNMFSEIEADFSGIDKSQNISAFDIFHKAVIEVDEGDDKVDGSVHLPNTPPRKESYREVWINQPFIGSILARGNPLVNLLTFRYTGPTDEE